MFGFCVFVLFVVLLITYKSQLRVHLILVGERSICTRRDGWETEMPFMYVTRSSPMLTCVPFSIQALITPVQVRCAVSITSFSFWASDKLVVRREKEREKKETELKHC